MGCKRSTLRTRNDFFVIFVSFAVSSAQALLSSIASGMMALTGIIFSLAFVMVQFGATAYSPRLVMWLGRELDKGGASGYFPHAHLGRLLDAGF
jgi:uncharacterized membrane protein